MSHNFRFSVSTCIRNSGILNYRSEILNNVLLVKTPPRAWLSTSQQLTQNNWVSYREIDTFSFSTKQKKFTIDVKEEDNISTFLKISELSNGRKSSVYVDKSALKTFISSIELVAKQKERVTFPNRNDRNMSLEYLGGRKGYCAIKIYDRRDGEKGSMIILPEEGMSDMIGYCKDIDNGTKEHQSS